MESIGRIHFEFKGRWVVSFNFIKILKSKFCSKHEEPDQTPRSVASDLVLHRLPMSHKKDAWLKCVKQIPLF